MLTDEKRELYNNFYQNSSDYYIRQMELYYENGRCSFSPAAFFLGIVWMAYRKMYTTIFIIAGIIFLEAAIQELLLTYEIISMSAYEIIDKLSMLIWGIVVGAISNRLYIRQSIRKMNKILEEHDDEERINYAISKKGGVNWYAPNIIIVLIILLLIIGV